MKNILIYYYNLYPDDIAYIKDLYSFSYNNTDYIFQKFERPISDIESLFKINEKMLDNNILVHKIIKNKLDSIITYINNEPYILMEYYVNFNKRINLSDICYINNNTIDISCDNLLNRYDWVNLWEIKNDYFESQISEIAKKHPKICNYANYYIGLAENAIIYVKKALQIKDFTLMSINHKRINCYQNLDELYHPFNYIYDYRVRDVCEYIKSLFFNNFNVDDVIEEYFLNNYLSYKEILLFYGRLLYPSYFFDLYDDIVNEKTNEKEIEKIILKQKKYEQFLIKLRSYLITICNKNIPMVEWLL